jgi:hypothetical protein
MAADVRSFDGTGNNLVHANWGAAGVDLLRLSPAAYADGISTPAVGNSARPSAREISNAVADQGSTDIVSRNGLSAMMYAWGQFLDHDLDLTGSGSPREWFNVAVPKGDPYFDPQGTGTQVIPLSRSLFDPATGTSTANPRQQVNTVTAWIDGSQIYGSDAVTADKLRAHLGGRMLTSAGNMLPINNAATFPTGTLPMANDAHRVPDNQLFAAGDVRANENIELLSLHTIFVREHNRIAGDLARRNPTWSDEQLYQAARKMVIGELQAITFREWLPAMLGTSLPAYRGYNANVNPGIANEFATAAFRLGHSMLGDDVEFLNNSGVAIDDAIELSDAFFNPPELTEHGVDSVLKYLASDPASEIDTKVVNSVRNFLFGPPGAGGLDLASLNIQRGRDHGLADYNTMRAAYGLPKVTSFEQITSDVALQSKLRSLYGNVNNIDAWVGMLAENHVRGASVGPLIQRVLIDQFTRLRDGDRFWYEKAFSPAEVDQLNRTTLADVIRRNTGLTNLQGNVFKFEVSIAGDAWADNNRDGRYQSLEKGVAGYQVQLIEKDTGEVVATTTTDARGHYRFDTLQGLKAGWFDVQVVMQSGWTATTRTVQTILISRGDVNAKADFGLAAPTPPPPPKPSEPQRPPCGPTRPGPQQFFTLFDPLGMNDPRKKK